MPWDRKERERTRQKERSRWLSVCYVTMLSVLAAGDSSSFLDKAAKAHPNTRNSRAFAPITNPTSLRSGGILLNTLVYVLGGQGYSYSTLLPRLNTYRCPALFDNSGREPVPLTEECGCISVYLDIIDQSGTIYLKNRWSRLALDCCRVRWRKWRRRRKPISTTGDALRAPQS